MSIQSHHQLFLIQHFLGVVVAHLTANLHVNICIRSTVGGAQPTFMFTIPYGIAARQVPGENMGEIDYDNLDTISDPVSRS